MISAGLQKAIDVLRVHDIYVRNLDAHCMGDFDPKYSLGLQALAIQMKHHIRQSAIVEFDGKRLFRVFVELGARWVNEESKSDADVKAVIEAEFIAEYLLTEALEQVSLDEFALINVSYHVWPYWRELLANQCLRMRLPNAILPIQQGANNRHSEQAK